MHLGAPAVSLQYQSKLLLIIVYDQSKDPSYKFNKTYTCLDDIFLYYKFYNYHTEIYTGKMHQK